MKNITRLLFVALLIVGATIPGQARMAEHKGNASKGTRDLKQTTAGCSPSSAFEWLNINNVRTRYNAGGDMWWDLPGGIGPQYFIPANGSATSLFAGALWIAGLDINNQLKCAAVRFRQDGNDFWTGPLTLKGASIDEVTCAQWDRIWKISRAEVDEFINHFDDEGHFIEDPDYTIPKSILDWPAHPDKVGGNIDEVSHYMAPFFDRDKNGEYNPESGDYPYYDIENKLCHTKIKTLEEQYYGEEVLHGTILADAVLKGDQTLWWVFNDKGNSHTESNGAAIGVEVRAQAFGFATNDEINNMSFCSYEIINRSTYELTGTYFCPWTDVDLGYAKDDYVGCDVRRGLGYGYNGTQIDGNGQPEAYGDQPPAVGVDFFQGPYMDADGLDNPKYVTTYELIGYTIPDPTHPNDSVPVYDTIYGDQLCDESINGVNFGNGIVDDERFGMRRFLYHNNDQSVTGDPDNAAETYLMLRGIWKDGNKMLYGGNAHPSVGGTVGPACDFMFPGDSDPCNWGTGGVPPGGGYNQDGKYWTDSEAGNPPADRRFMQSAGPFTLKPGAVNYITFGVPWARAASGGPLASVELLRVTDDKCQALFDNCFKVIDGPSAPDLTIRELDKKLIIYLSNSAISNNYKEGYVEIDPEIPEYRPDDSTQLADRNYRFEGYKVYQLVDDQVGADELNNNSKARLIFQCDIKNGVTNLVNFEYDDHIGALVPALKVEGGDGGITHSFVVTEDRFATGENPSLVNHKTYYFMAVAYAYNNFQPYSQDPLVYNGLYGQTKPYLEGRKNISVYSAVPHQIMNGTVLQCDYGQQPSITRVVGQGNGGNEIELTQESIDELFSKKEANTLDDDGNKIVFGHPDYPIIYHPTYKVGYGPVAVKVIDPLNVKTTSYEMWFDTLQEVVTYGVSSNANMLIKNPDGTYSPGSSAKRLSAAWYLKDLESDEEPVRSDTTIVYGDEKLFIDKGISVTIAQPYEVGVHAVGYIYSNSGGTVSYKQMWEVLAPNTGMITSSLTFQDSTDKWLDGVRDKDIPGSPLNWIRSGSYRDPDVSENNDWNMDGSSPYDPSESFEKIANRTWAPLTLCAFKEGSVFPLLIGDLRKPEYFAKTSSVDIVLTADKSKWTRCPVVEMCSDPALSVNGAKQFRLRRSASIDKDGNPYMYNGKVFDDWDNDTTAMFISDNPEDANFVAPMGMGWFPGYAIDVESGARLNIIYGEDSYLEDLNGNDMIFNPPMLMKNTVDEVYGDNSQLYDPVMFRQVDQEPVFGGKHYVFVLGMDKPTDVQSNTYTIPKEVFNRPAYDAGRSEFELLYRCDWSDRWFKNFTRFLWRSTMYVGMPMGVEGTNWLGLKDDGTYNDAKIRIRVSKPYAPGYASVALDSLYEDLNINGLNPVYRFSIDGLEPTLNDPVKTESDLDKITIVPNPYYAYSSYEKNALNNLVKITNLPNNCTVTIYNLAGTKIRQFKKDNDLPSIDWDLTNFANTPVASGFYLIHVKDNTSGGERTIKFFGAMRLIDLNTF